MKYRLFSVVLALVCLLMLFMAVPRAQAHSRVQARPSDNTLCGNALGCLADTTWGGSSTNHGNGSTFTVDNPGGSSLFFYRKGVDESNANGYDIFLGVVKNDARCNGLSFMFNVNHNGNEVFTDCSPVPTGPNGDINRLADIELSYYASNGGGIFYNITGFTGSIWSLKGFACSGCTQAFNHVENEFSINYTSFTGHAVWGGQWINNEYFDGAWHYDATSSNPVTINNNGHGNPPQMYWASKPNGSQNTGGDLRSCLYDNTSNSCNLGS